MNYDYKKKLETEKEKLNRLVDEALENGTPLSQAKEIMKQCKKIEKMVIEIDEQEFCTF